LGLSIHHKFALVGFGKVVERPWEVEKQVVSSPVLTATLSAGHQVMDGRRGGPTAVDPMIQDSRAYTSNLTAGEIRQVVLRIPGEVAPEADLSSLKPDGTFRD
jgi:hypothetical protein